MGIVGYNMNKVKILGVGSSPRKNGNTDILLDCFLKGAASKGAETKKVFLRDYSIESCIGCEACRKDGNCTKFYDGMQLLYPEIEDCKGLILGSPTYNYNVTSDMKAFIDRLYPFYEFSEERPGPYSSKLADQGRKALVFTVCEQVKTEEMGFTLEALAMPLEALGYDIFDKFQATGCCSKGEVRNNNDIIEKAFDAGKEFAVSIR